MQDSIKLCVYGGGALFEIVKYLISSEMSNFREQFYKVKLAALYTVKFVPKIHAKFEKFLNDFLF